MIDCIIEPALLSLPDILATRLNLCHMLDFQYTQYQILRECGDWNRQIAVYKHIACYWSFQNQSVFDTSHSLRESSLINSLLLNLPGHCSAIFLFFIVSSILLFYIPNLFSYVGHLSSLNMSPVFRHCYFQ